MNFHVGMSKDAGTTNNNNYIIPISGDGVVTEFTSNFSQTWTPNDFQNIRLYMFAMVDSVGTC